MTSLQRALCYLLAIASCGVAVHKSHAVVLASDDFSGAGSGFGWVTGNDWEGLDGGVVSTNPGGTGSVQSFRDFATPLDASDGVVYIKVDYAQLDPGTGLEWGGLAFFTGVEGNAGDETFFLGNPSGPDNYGMDLKNGTEVISPIAIDGGVHTLVAMIDTSGADDAYSLWVDNVNLNAPTAAQTLVGGGGPITAPWGTLRLASSDLVTDAYDNLVIATTPGEVGLVASTLTMTVDRSTGSVSLSSSTPLNNVVGYSILSTAGSLQQPDWIPVAGNYDVGGTGLVDFDDSWAVETTDLAETTRLAEGLASASPGDGGVIGGTAVDLGEIWARTPFEDLYATVVVDDGGTPMSLAANVVYTGAAPAFGDLDGDGDLDAADWGMFKSGQGVVDGTLPIVAAYQMGDLNGDFDHTLADFDIFAETYDAANGPGAFVAMVQGVPEPSALLLAACGALAWAIRPRRIAKTILCLGAGVLAAALAGDAAHAVIFAQDDFSAEGTGSGWVSGDTWENVSGGVADTAVGNAKYRALATPLEPYLYDKVYIDFDIQFTDANQWGGVSFHEGPDGGTETLFIGAPGAEGYTSFGIDLKQGQNLPGDPGQGVAIDGALHRLVVELDFDDDITEPFDDKYSLWVDNADINSPNSTVTIQDSPIVQGWQSVRLQSAGGGEFFQVDNLMITDDPNLVFSPTLALVVDKATGDVTLHNPTTTPIPMSAYSINSGSGSLNTGAAAGDFDASGLVDGHDLLEWQRQFPALDGDDLADWQSNFAATGGGVGGWESLADQDGAGFAAGDGSGNGWEEGANPGPGEVEEYFLTGESTVGVGVSMSLGDAYGGGAAGTEDLHFVYRSNGELVVGAVSYTNSAAVAAVPEPATIVLAVLAGLVLAGRRRRR